MILRYTVRNDGARPCPTTTAGVFCDWDIGDSASNLGGTDASRSASYMYPSTGGTGHYGVALLQPSTYANLTLISNPTHVYPNGYIDDGMKVRHIQGIISLTSTATADDWSALTSAGPSVIGPGEEVVYVFAMVWGEDLADFQAQRGRRRGRRPHRSHGRGAGPRAPRRDAGPERAQPLQPPHRDPLLGRAGTAGAPGGLRPQRRTGEGADPAQLRSGEHSVVWLGDDAAGGAAPSGLYLYRIETDESSTTRKMMLVR